MLVSPLDTVLHSIVSGTGKLSPIMEISSAIYWIDPTASVHEFLLKIEQMQSYSGVITSIKSVSAM